MLARSERNTLTRICELSYIFRSFIRIKYAIACKRIHAVAAIPFRMAYLLVIHYNEMFSFSPAVLLFLFFSLVQSLTTATALIVASEMKSECSHVAGPGPLKFFISNIFHVVRYDFCCCSVFGAKYSTCEHFIETKCELSSFAVVFFAIEVLLARVKDRIAIEYSWIWWRNKLHNLKIGFLPHFIFHKIRYDNAKHMITYPFESIGWNNGQICDLG